jgi:hypothetical protein
MKFTIGNLSPGASPPSNPIRGSTVKPLTTIVASSTINIPAAAQAGDFAVFYLAHSWTIAGVPTGWTNRSPYGTGPNWNSAIYTKVLTSGDISAGSVACNFDGSGYGFLELVVFVGATGGYRDDGGTRNGTGASSRTVTTGTAVQVGDYLLLIGSAYLATAATSSSLSSTVDFGNNPNVSGICRYGLATVAGAQTATVNYAGSPGGDAQVLMAIAP